MRRRPFARALAAHCAGLASAAGARGYNVPVHSLLAVDIGGTNHSVAMVRAGRASFEIVERLRCPTRRTGGRGWLLPRIEAQCRELMGRARQRPRGCGIGFGGPVDFRAQRIRRSLHAGGWGGFALAAHLSEHLGLPCVMDNDANTAALGEFAYGAGQGSASLVYLTVSTGVGGGVVLDGGVYRGTRGLAGEVGHITLIPQGGPRCSCGRRGCVEAVCSGTALGAAARAAARRRPRKWRAVIEEAGGLGSIEARTVFDGARRGHVASRALVEAYCAQLGRAIAGVIALLDPGTIVIGGGVSLAGGALFGPLRRAIAAQLPQFLARGAGSQPPWRCVPAALRENSVLAGAACLALRYTSTGDPD